jgi:hypothetical protein
MKSKHYCTPRNRTQNQETKHIHANDSYSSFTAGRPTITGNPLDCHYLFEKRLTLPPGSDKVGL